MFLAVLMCSLPHESLRAATLGQDAVAYLEQQLGLNDRQAKGALGALLVLCAGTALPSRSSTSLPPVCPTPKSSCRWRNSKVW